MILIAILIAPPEEWLKRWLKKRPAIPVAVKLAAMLRRYPSPPLSVLCQPSDSAKLVAMFAVYGRHHFHHAPGVWERKFDTEKNDTIPSVNDPEFIIAVTPEEHDAIENGPGGTKRITSAGSAANRRGKIRRANKQKTSRGPKLRSRGFYKDPNFKRTVGGKVVPRRGH
jgi:hypothetical protein